VLPIFQAGDTRSPRWDMIWAVASEFRPSRREVASRAWTRRPRPRAGSYEEYGEEQCTERPEPASSGQDRRAISVQLARVTSGQSRTLPVTRHSWSAAVAAWISQIPKLIVRVRSRHPLREPGRATHGPQATSTRGCRRSLGVTQPDVPARASLQVDEPALHRPPGWRLTGCARPAALVCVEYFDGLI
jgi:hypothetical protein